MKKSLIFLSMVLLAVTAANRTAAESDQYAQWAWVGAVTSSSAVVKAKILSSEDQVRLIFSENAKLLDSSFIPARGSAKPDSDGVVVFAIEALQPETEYFYALEVGGNRSLGGRFRTFSDGPSSFRVAFGSCARTGSESRNFETIRRQDPLFFVHMGDFHYENIGVNDPSRFRAAMDSVLDSATQSALYRNVPIAYVWDDHDFGPDNSDGTSPSRPAALEVYRQYVPHYPLANPGDPESPIFQSFSSGRVRFILTDVRSQRDPVGKADGPEKTMLGKKQRDWLEQELLAAKENHVLIVWVNVVPWITKADPGGKHGWEPFSHERTYLADFIKRHGLVDKLLILSGDGHMVAIDDGTNSNYASDRKKGESSFPVMHAAPMDRYPRIKGGPYSHGAIAPKKFFGLTHVQQFGLMQITDEGQDLLVELSGHNKDGEVLEGMQLNLRCTDGGCTVADNKQHSAKSKKDDDSED